MARRTILEFVIKDANEALQIAIRAGDKVSMAKYARQIADAAAEIAASDVGVL